MNLLPIDELRNMKNVDLGRYCKENGIYVEAKNVSKPTKKEYINAIVQSDKFIGDDDKVVNITQDEVLKVTPTEDESETLSPVEDFMAQDDKSQQVKKKDDKAMERERLAKQRKELLALKHVLITEPHKQQTHARYQTFYVTWGNSVIGHHTDKFILDHPWHVRKGALQNIKESKVSIPYLDERGNVRTRIEQKYNIQYLDDLSKEEIALIAKKQLLRESAKV